MRGRWRVTGASGRGDQGDAAAGDRLAAVRRLCTVTPLSLARRGLGRRTTDPPVRMVHRELPVDGRVLTFEVTDNHDAHGPTGPGSPPIWAVNLHGYFAGGTMYGRESAILAERLGWRVVNPSLPGFGGSGPLPWGEISMASLAAEVERLVDHLGTGPVVLLGHSMGAAVAVAFARRHPDLTLGIVYRAGVATPAWKHRRSLITALVSPLLPDMAPLADIMAAVILDTPDLFIGRVLSTMTSMLPDFRRNLRSMAATVPVGTMLLTIDQRDEVRALAASGLPLLAEWGCFDRVATGATAEEFAACARTRVQWLPGGHSWMLARPEGQADVLRHLPSGTAFVDAVETRWAERAGRGPGLALAN